MSNCCVPALTWPTSGDFLSAGRKAGYPPCFNAVASASRSLSELYRSMAMTNCEASAPASPEVCALMLNSSGPLGSLMPCPCARSEKDAHATIASAPHVERFSKLTSVKRLLRPARWFRVASLAHREEEESEKVRCALHRSSLRSPI